MHSVVSFVSFALLPLIFTQSETQLFNGKNLEGWNGDPEIWKVEDGQIVGSTIEKKIKANTFLISEVGPVSDFELTFDVKLVGNNNSGVQYRSTVKNPEKWVVVGYQADIHANPPYTGMLYGEGIGRGIIAQRGQKVIVNEEGKVTKDTLGIEVKPVDLSQWHSMKIIAKGNRLIHQLDGETVMDLEDNHPKKLESGIIALQVHAGAEMTVYFKNIVLKK